MKICTKCKLEKDFSCFGKCKTFKDGYLYHCKECIQKYREENKERMLEYCKRYRESNRELISKRNKDRYRKDKKTFLNRTKKYLKSEKGKSKSKEYRLKNRDKIMARRHLNLALIKNNIIKPSNCEMCNKNDRLQGHHHSYSKEYWLDVMWLCLKCHNKIHSK